MSDKPTPREQHDRLVKAIRKDVINISKIYPTAFDLYEEPLERLTLRIVETVEKHNKSIKEAYNAR